MSVVVDTVLTYLPAKRKTTPSGWTHSMPRVVTITATQQIHVDVEASYKMTAESPITVLTVVTNVAGNRATAHKMRRLLQWLGTADDVINKVALDVMRENEGVQAQGMSVVLPEFVKQYSYPTRVSYKTGQKIGLKRQRIKIKI